METQQEQQEQKLLLTNFVKALNKEPDMAEAEKTPDGNASYFPISFIEMTLDELFFGLWSTENFKWSAITNEVQGSLDLVCIHPVTGQEIRRTGAASIVIMVDRIDPKIKDNMSSQERNLYALNPENKKPNALDMAFPKLKTECLKNAAQSLGKRFGRDVNRKKSDTFKPQFDLISDKALQAAIERVERGQDAEAVLSLARTVFYINEDQIQMIKGAKQLTLK